MAKEYNLTGTPKVIVKFFNRFRKWKLNKYKKKKVRKEKTFHDRFYFVKFKVKMDDPINPKLGTGEYEMFIPAKAAFFAKIKATNSIRKKISLDFINCEMITSEEMKELEKSKSEYIKVKR